MLSDPAGAEWLQRIPDIFLGALLAVAIMAAGYDIGSQYQPDPTNPPQHTAAENAQQPPESGLWDWVPHGGAGFFTLWLVIAAQLGLCVWQLTLIRKSTIDAGAAADAAKQSADTARIHAETARDLQVMQDTAQRQLRAYVSVSGVTKVEDLGEWQGAGFAVRVEVKNDGQTPAYDLLHWAKIELREFPLVGRLSIHCVDEDTREILPAGSKTVAFATCRHGLTASEEQAIIANEKALYVCGEVDYLDAFGGRRLTQFRFRCNGPDYPLGVFKADGAGNEAT
jgi:hypothetical protein